MRNIITLNIFAFLFLMICGCEKGEIPELKNSSIDYKDSTLTEVASLQFFQSSIKVGESMDIELFSSLYRNIDSSNIVIKVGTTTAIVNSVNCTNNGKKYLMNITIPVVNTGLYDLKAVLTTDKGNTIELKAENQLSVTSLVAVKKLYISSVVFTALVPKQSVAFSANYMLKLIDNQTGEAITYSPFYTFTWNGGQWTTAPPTWTISPALILPNYKSSGYRIELYEGSASALRGAINLNLANLTPSITSADYASSGQTLDFGITVNFEWH